MKKIPHLLFLGLIFIAMSCDDPKKPRSNCGTVPNGSSKSLLRIIQISVNPEGDLDHSESFTFRNYGSSDIEFKGWTVKSNNDYVWSLDQIQNLKSCDRITYISVPRDELKNTQGWIQLISPDNELIQTVKWVNAAEGEYVYPD